MKFINEFEYGRLHNKYMSDSLVWNLQEVDVYIDRFIDSIFESNYFLCDIFFYSEYNILKYDSKKSIIDFDNHCCIQFKTDIVNVSDFKTITGIVAFPYVNWSDIDDYICDIPTNWSLFIINPILIKYKSGSVGLFLTPTYANDLFIDECNNFIKSKTGYPLFLKYTNNSNIPEINFEKPDLSLKNFIKEMKKNANKALTKLLDFWADNECVNVSLFEYSYDNYMNNLSYPILDDIDLKTITSTISFKIIHENTGKELGVFRKFSLDKSFNLAYTDHGVLKLTKSQIIDLIDGKYDFELIGD